MTTPEPLSLDLLEQLERCWRASRLPVVDRLRGGIGAEELARAEERLGFPLPPEARTWWGWHDGVAATDIVRATERDIGARGFGFLPLEEAIARTEMMAQLAEEIAATLPDGDPGSLWNPAWLTLTRSATGDVVACDCSDPRASITPVTVVAWGDRAETGPVVGSLGELVKVWISAFDDGSWRWDAASGRWLPGPPTRERWIV